MGALGIPGGVFERAAGPAAEFGADAVELLTGRAALRGHQPRGAVSAGGATHLLAAIDGWWALTLSRADDVAAVPALLESQSAGVNPWPDLRLWSAGRTAAQVVERALLLGLPAAALAETGPAAPRIRSCAAPVAPRPLAGLLVADLTSMWAGPLCGRLLARAGATVVKVESPQRPDGTRADTVFFDWLNAAKLGYAVDFDSGSDRLARLLSAADVILEGSRPAGLLRRGLGPDDLAGRPGRVWLRVTGYGAEGPAADRVAFGDDAAVAGGLVAVQRGAPVFVGDALADPLTGLQAAAAVSASIRRGGGELIEIALAAVAADYAGAPDTPGVGVDPKPPVRSGPGPALGADTVEVERLIAERLSAAC